MVVRPSVGRWEGDTLVVESVGFKDQDVDRQYGTPGSDRLKVTERFRRLNFGTLEIELTIDDSKTFTRPFTVTFQQRLMPDTELMNSSAPRTTSARGASWGTDAAWPTERDMRPVTIVAALVASAYTAFAQAPAPRTDRHRAGPVGGRTGAHGAGRRGRQLLQPDHRPTSRRPSPSIATASDWTCRAHRPTPMRTRRCGTCSACRMPAALAHGRPAGMRTGVEMVEITKAEGKPLERRLQDSGAFMLIAIVRDIDAPFARLKQLGRARS